MLTLEYYRFATLPIKLSKFKILSPEVRNSINNNLSLNGNYLVDVICFVLMPNHFHFLLKQKIDGGISKYLSQFTNSYTRYFNTKNNRVGPMFQGVFKSVQVESQEQLSHLSRYIHLNPYVSSSVTKIELPNYPWSSLPNYLSGKNGFVATGDVLSQFFQRFTYKDFIFDHSDYARRLELVKHQTIDLE